LFACFIKHVSVARSGDYRDLVIRDENHGNFLNGLKSFVVSLSKPYARAVTAAFSTMRFAPAATRAAVTSSACEQSRLRQFRMNELERNSAMFAIDCEIRIERQHGVPLVDLGHPHDAGVGE
jgi:hypothetical protein